MFIVLSHHGVPDVKMWRGGNLEMAWWASPSYIVSQTDYTE